MTPKDSAAHVHETPDGIRFPVEGDPAVRIDDKAVQGRAEERKRPGQTSSAAQSHTNSTDLHTCGDSPSAAMTLGELLAHVEEAIRSGGPNLPVIVKIDGEEPLSLPVAAATKRGASFRIYPEAKSRV